MVKTLVALLVALSALSALAQTEPQKTGTVPIYRIIVVARTTQAINYRHRSGSTRINFQGTTLLPEARGNAQVASKQGAIRIESEFQGLQSASKFGPEYLTYVLWAISPEGRPVNLGEVLFGTDGKSKLNVTSNLQAFGMIVTAEPYFAVTQPSDVVVMENEVRADTKGQFEEVEAKYELLKRGQYELNVNPAELQPISMDSRTPLELYEARNAVRIAKWTGAEHYASDSLNKAKVSLQSAEDYQARRGNKKSEITAAREAVQTAEDARIISVKKIDEERQASELQVSADAEARAKAQADAATQQKKQAETDAAAARAQTAQNQAASDAAAAKAQAEAAQTQAASEAALAKAQAETDAAKAKAQADTEQARLAAQQAENDKAALRAKLAEQLNSVLQTRDTARGLIVNMSDVLFDTAKYTLKPGAREKLSKVAGILLAYPGLNIEVDGHTDNVGGDEYNQNLSEQRAGSVRDYLVAQGVATNSVTAKGFGKTQPVATNDTAEGRQINRRVELVVSGEAIGAR
ncbi:MAG: OmpA family protein [Terriglobia bacterium]|jgi:outer membrane protein OmpA-like peptidoglycan-associated protein